MMSRAIHLARKGEGFVEPNPMVGCVIARGGRIIGEGRHRRFGGAHAEVNALDSCKTNPRGATGYVTLEPCNHFGHTPPCADALIEAGIARVVAGVRDPNPIVDGGGFEKLRRAGIAVEVGIRSDVIAELIAPFATRILLKRPYIIAKWAQSLDGKLATRTGDSKWISGEASWRRVHQLRARVDAILVGSGTVLSDDPLLTARDVPIRRVALRVVLDARLRIPEKCRLMDTIDAAPMLIFTSPSKAQSAKAKRLRSRGAAVEAVTFFHHPISLQAVVKRLALRGATNLLVEGGPAVLSSFLEERLVDEAHVFVAPMLVGGEKAPSAWLGMGATTISSARKPVSIHVRHCDDDLHYQLRFSGAQDYQPEEKMDASAMRKVADKLRKSFGNKRLGDSTDMIRQDRERD